MAFSALQAQPKLVVALQAPLGLVVALQAFTISTLCVTRLVVGLPSSAFSASECANSVHLFVAAVPRRNAMEIGQTAVADSMWTP